MRSSGTNGPITARTPTLTCAVYCRKSTDENLDSAFNSLDAQREACLAYVTSQKHQGWVPFSETFEDGGFSGATVDRPALQQMLNAVEAGRIQCVLVYRSDRLSRRILDFLQMMEVFDRHNVAFVSVTEQFNTSTPGGRLYQHMLLSFAEYERGIIAERTRDKVHAARRKGKFTGGGLILGYDRHPDGGLLVVNETEARRVRKVFRMFEEHPSLVDIVRELNRRGWTLKQWTTKTGRQYGGGPFDVHSLRRLLSNHAYIGRVHFRGSVYDGEHEAIVDQETWDRVQELLKNGSRGPRRPSSRCTSLLAGILRCAPCDAAMTPTYSQKGRVRYPYYLCTKAHLRGWDSCSTKSVSAKKIETFVVEKIRGIGRDLELVDQTVEAARQQVAARKAELEAEAKRIRSDLEKSHGDLRKSLKAVPANSRAWPKDAPAREDAIRALEERLHTVNEEVTALDGQQIDPTQLKATLAAFDPIWAQLEPAEQARVMQLLIERIDYDGGSGNLAIAFRPGGVKTLVAEAQTSAEEGP